MKNTKFLIFAGLTVLTGYTFNSVNHISAAGIQLQAQQVSATDVQSLIDKIKDANVKSTLQGKLDLYKQMNVNSQQTLDRIASDANAQIQKESIIDVTDLTNKINSLTDNVQRQAILNELGAIDKTSQAQVQHVQDLYDAQALVESTAKNAQSQSSTLLFATNKQAFDAELNRRFATSVAGINPGTKIDSGYISQKMVEFYLDAKNKNGSEMNDKSQTEFKTDQEMFDYYLGEYASVLNSMFEHDHAKPTPPVQAPVVKNGGKLENYNGIFYKNGVAQKGGLLDNGTGYHFNNSGIMETGGVYDNGTGYFMNANGSMKTGGLQSQGKGYYLNQNGSMAKGGFKEGRRGFGSYDDGSLYTKVGGEKYKGHGMYSNGIYGYSTNEGTNGYYLNANGYGN